MCFLTHSVYNLCFVTFLVVLYSCVLIVIYVTLDDRIQTIFGGIHLPLTSSRMMQH